MKAMILGAGAGTRLSPLTDKCPKPMLPIGGKPLLEHTLALLRHHEIKEVVINLHHNPDVITGHFGDGSMLGLQITYSYEDQLLGTAGAVRKVAECFDETFIVIYGDVFTNVDLTELYNFHQLHRSSVTIGLYRVTNPSECGLVELDGNGRILRFIEKPAPNEMFTDLANAGVYVVEPDILDHIPEDVPSDFGHDIFPCLLNNGMLLSGYLILDYLIDIGSFEKYEKAKRDWKEGKLI